MRRILRNCDAIMILGALAIVWGAGASLIQAQSNNGPANSVAEANAAAKAVARAATKKDAKDTKPAKATSKDHAAAKPATAAGNDNQIPPALEQRLDEMSRHIEELEAELKAEREERRAAAMPAAAANASAPASLPGTMTNAKSAAVSAPVVAIASGVSGTTSAVPAGSMIATPAPATTASPAVAVASTSAATETIHGPSKQGAPTEKKKPIAPFSDYDWTWLNGNPRTETPAFDSTFFTPEIRADIDYVSDFNHPSDHSMGGSSELFRTSEVQLEQLGVGGDFHYDNVRARLMTQFGMYSATTPRNDASPGHGQWDLDTAYRYVSEAYGGYHFDVMHGINVDAGIFMSYIGLFSYYNFDNWAYQPSYVSSNTPWFFNGVRVQIFPTAHLKIEPWFINGWQSYASANHRPGVGGQIKWTPVSWMNIISNNYGLGQDDLFTPGRKRIHTDDSIEIKYFDRPDQTLDKMAFTLTGDAGCEYGGGVSCHGDTAGGPKQSFLGYMLYNRFWFHKDLYAITIGGGKINNPGRYLVLLPPINGEGAISAATNSPYFTENPGDPFKAWDSSFTFDYMPKQYITFRWEYDYRYANVPYWSGRGGITPPGGNTGFPTQYVCSNGVTSGQTTLGSAEASCTALEGLTGPPAPSSVWFPDLRRDESFIDMDIMVKF